MTDHEGEGRIRELLDEAYPQSKLHFDSGFADRVLARTQRRAAPEHELSSALLRQGKRVIPLLVAASLALVAWNLSVSRAPEQATESVSMLQGAEAFQ